MKKRLQRLCSALLIIIFSFNLLPFSVISAAPLDEAREAARYYSKGGGDLTLDWWDIAGLAAAGLKAEGFAVERRENTAAASIASNVILDILAGEGEDSDTDGLSALLEGEGQGATVNDYIWAVIALNMANAQFDRAAAARALLSLQLGDGGFAFAGASSDADMTGMALTALAAVRGEEGVAAAIERAVNFLRGAQDETGGFKDLDFPEYSYFGEVNPNSTASVLTGLIDAGEDIEDDGWKKSGRTIADALLAFKAEGGGFFAPFAPDVPNKMATAQALVALGAYANGESVFLNPPKAWDTITPQNGGGEEPGAEGDKKEISIKILGHSGKIAETPAGYETRKITAFDALLEFSENENINVDYEESSMGIYLKAIGGQTPEKSSYWAFAACCAPAFVGAGDYILNEGDDVIFYYSGFYAYVSAAALYEGEKFEIRAVKTGYDFAAGEQTIVGVPGALVSYDGKTAQTDDDGAAKFTALGGEKNAKITISRESDADLWEDFEKTISISAQGGGTVKEKSVYLKVTGDGRVFLPRQAIPIAQGDTPITVLLKKFPKSVVRGGGAAQYVVSINGLAEFDRGAESGWKYKVNGDVKNQSASGIELRDGDEVEWFYVYTAGQNSPSAAALLPAATHAPDELIEEMQPGLAGRGGIDFLAKNLSAEGFIPAVLALSGEKSPEIRQTILEYINENGSPFRKVTDIERTVINALMQDMNPEDLDGRNLIKEIISFPDIQAQGINGVCFGLIALDFWSAGGGEAESFKENLVKIILERQNSDGGFPLSAGESEVDITAFAVTALSNHLDSGDVKKAVDSAVSWLETQKTPENGYKSAGGEENAESLSWVIIAKCALGLDPADEMSALSKYERNDGAFSHIPGGGADPIATEQALLAYAAYERFGRGEGLFQKLSGAAAPRPSFAPADIDEISPWARASMEAAIEAKIIRGDERGRVNPGENLTRAQLAAMLVRAFKPSGAAAPAQVFEDVKASDWFYEDVVLCHSLGLMRGYSESVFAPDDYVSRQELAVIAARALKLEGGALAPADIGEADTWAREGIRAVFTAEIMVGDGANFSPRAAITREQAVKTLMEAIKVSEGRGIKAA